MKRLIILMLLMTVLVACNTEKDETEATELEESTEVEEPKEDSKEDSKDEAKEESQDEQVEEETTTDASKEESEEKIENNKPKEEDKQESAVKNEEVEVAAENIIWAQNDRDYSELKSYLGQNITLNEEKNTLDITNVDYPHEAELLEGIEKADLEHRFTHEEGKDTIVGFAAIDRKKEMSYTIDLTMRVGKDSWKMLNMQINK